ncbi:Hypothetical protein LOCK908_2697 [Lacticaseibacillus rhamnosus LOCK908]|uniref:Uncharacterized protein n=1 Tax=Lacticaseibacillus rhamnosus (strain LMS2-1) TaxID=525361 RepID=C2JUW2_LACRM|nr:conserved hypothetical protein [Lacticaseibacillus rhamnosus ATCC 8530]AGP72392.1 Hypothetical protein LOCK900_2614 [Lacticaseibacillus rhamnosus LOCK900]AGP75304.1 Hypothetical protein LOCK908_2697 [Lacticaseibacillus rhamnosus LOCK908]ASY48543.1 hypothetical protein N507_1367 [Lacticaseibacillus rhamnosus DSM 14870]EEN81170.1 hypothetical protein HMPREF0539_0696 [Lacticaseibacillus rhamnosus LMS2-1]EHJ25090.1 hypothetical protein HMPREF0541_02951 [Lacticaseibacillus rhamnosus ATCC 21052]
MLRKLEFKATQTPLSQKDKGVCFIRDYYDILLTSSFNLKT